MATSKTISKRTSKAPAKKAPAKASAKKAPAKKEAPAAKVKEARKITTRAAIANPKDLTVSPGLTDDQKAKVGQPAGNGNAGYVVRWPNKGADILIRTDSAKGTGNLWRVRCNAHNVTTEVPDDDTRSRRYLATREGRTTWCSACKAEAK